MLTWKVSARTEIEKSGELYSFWIVSAIFENWIVEFSNSFS